MNGQKVADARIDQTQCCMFSLDEGADVDRNKGTPVTEDYKIPICLQRVIDKVTITLGETPEAEHAASDAVRGKSG